MSRSPEGDSRIKITWNLGLSAEELANLPASFSGKICWRNTACSSKPCDGDLLINGVDTEEPETFLPSPSEVNGTAAFRQEDKPDISYAIELGTQPFIFHRIESDGERESKRLTGKQVQRTGSIVVDFGNATIPPKGYPPVWGLDFFALDGFHVPASPVRNLLPNPSFEQGLRYWGPCDGGSKSAPGQENEYQIVQNGLYGKHALQVQKVRGDSIRTAPFQLAEGKTYMLSFYARSDKAATANVRFISQPFTGKFGVPWQKKGDSSVPEKTNFSTTTEWKRFTRTFVPDNNAMTMTVSASKGATVLLDGFQLEEGDTATEFVCAPMEGNLVSGSGSRDLIKGNPVELKFDFSAKPLIKADLQVRIINAYREELFNQTFVVQAGQNGCATLPLPVDAQCFDEGIFIVRCDYQAEGKTFTEYHRFSIFSPLQNAHATSGFFANSVPAKTLNIEKAIQKTVEWGIGGTSWGDSLDPRRQYLASLKAKYKIQDFVWSRHDLASGVRKLDAIPDGMIEHVLKGAYEYASQCDPQRATVYAFGNEEEHSGGSKLTTSYDEYFKLQNAFMKGVLAADPSAKSVPTNGTCSINPTVQEGYITAAKKQGILYDGISTHAYGYGDGGVLEHNDLVRGVTKLLEVMDRHGYPKDAPLYITEAFNVPFVNIPQWGAGLWNDSYRNLKSPTYDLGVREFLHAATAARIWITGLRFFPRLKCINVWVSDPFEDVELTPILLLKAANTLGHHFPDVQHYADIRPTGDIRGQVFMNPNQTAVAAVWTIRPDVENAYANGPTVSATFGQPVTCYDMIGAKRTIETSNSGVSTFALTAAPLILHANNAEKLTQSLQKMTADNMTKSIALSIVPTLNNELKVQVKNLTGQSQTGKVHCGPSVQIQYNVAAGAVQSIPFLSMNEKDVSTKWAGVLYARPDNGTKFKNNWSVECMSCAKCEGAPNWNAIPKIPVTNRHGNVKDSADLSASYQLSYDDDNLHINVEAEDDHLLFSAEIAKKPAADNALWLNDGALELYIDCLADGRTSVQKGFGLDDYRYDFAIASDGQNGPGRIWRLIEPNQQMAGGLEMATKQDAKRELDCQFKKSDMGYCYTIRIPQKFLEPLILKQGAVFGFGLYLHDKDEDPDSPCEKGINTAVKAGEHCNHRPDLWPLVILK